MSPVKLDFFPTCRTCGAHIAWVKTTSGKNMPLNPSAPGGNIVVLRAGERLEAHVLSKGEAPEHGEPTYTSHFVTCPQRDQHRRKR